MSKPLTHAQNNVEKYGGVVTDYIEIHKLIDSSKVGLGDKRHRAATHNSWFIYSILPLIFGDIISNSDGKEISVTQIGEDHVLEDYQNKFIPTLEDFLLEIPMSPWMDNGNGYPPSCEQLFKRHQYSPPQEPVFDDNQIIDEDDYDNFRHIDVDWRSMPLDVRVDKQEKYIKAAPPKIHMGNTPINPETTPLFFTNIGSD